MAFTALSRLSKLKVTFLGVVLLFLVAVYTPRHRTADELAAVSSIDLESWSGLEAKLAEKAHRLPNTDALFRHFKAVLEMPYMTLAEAKSGCSWNVSEQIGFQFNADVDWNQKGRPQEEIENKREQWQEFVKNDMLNLPYHDHQHRFNGRGIVVIAGDLKTLIRVHMLLKALVRLGSQLPVEIHYYDNEMSEESKANLTSIWPDIYFNDLSASTNAVKTTYGPVEGRNYQFKTAALVNSRFAEPIMLDADNIPVLDPASLYESPVYKEYGTLFWPDIARTRPANPMWAITNTKCRMNEYEQESGQLVVDKRKFYYHLRLSHFFASDAWYYGQILLGDKDLFRFSWHALKTKYGFPPKWVTSVGTINDGFYCGHTFAQHHPDGRVAFMHAGFLKMMANQVMRWQRETNGGVYQVYKRSKYDENHEVNVQNRIKWDNADYLPRDFKTDPVQVGWCVDYDQVTIRPLEEIVPGFEKTFDEIGGYWPVHI